MEKSLSEAAKWFLAHLRKTLEEFGDREVVQVVVVDKDGELVNETYGVERVCKLILSTDEGKIRCRDHFKSALPLVKSQKKPIFTECYAGFVSVWMPIIARDVVVGAIIACGGRQDKCEPREKLEKKFSKLADELAVLQKEDFRKAAIDDVFVISEQSIIEERAKKIEELIYILLQSTNTPLKEVLG
jgi:ligand-binding sensor protein